MSLLTEIKELSCNFAAFKFTYASRNCSRVAHELAMQGMVATQAGEWHVAPTCVIGLLASDCNHE